MTMPFSGEDEPYVIWSMEHQAWWCAGHLGYSTALAHAGWYSYAEAIAIVQKANIVKCHEAMIPLSALRREPFTAEQMAQMRADVAKGAGHDCDEWWDAATARCQLCNRPRPFTCPVCARTSHNPNDFLNRYCGFCHRFFGKP